jgi:hypothetical protein
MGIGTSTGSNASPSSFTGFQRALHARWIVAVLITVAVLGGGILGIHFATHIDVTLLLSDPAEQAALPFYTGSYTYIGAIALFSTLAVCLFAASLPGDHEGTAIHRSFLVSLGALSAWLGLDDLFMFHEWAGLAIAEARGQDEIPGARSRLEGVVFAAYGAAWLAWVRVYWRTIRHTSYILLLLALGGLAMSVALDVGIFFLSELIPDTAWMPTTLAVAEEMLKLTGIFFLLAYGADTSRKVLHNPSTQRAPASYGR